MKKEIITIERLKGLQDSISYLGSFGVSYKSSNVLISQDHKNYKDIDIVCENGDISYSLTDKLYKLAELNIERDRIINEIMNSKGEWKWENQKLKK